MGIRQHIPEQVRLQRFLRVLRNQNLEGHPQLLTRLGAVQLLLYLLHHEAVAQGLLGGHIGGLVQHRVHRGQAIFLEHLLEVELLRECLIIGDGNGRQVPLREGLQNPVLQGLGVQVTAGLATAKNQRLAVFRDDGGLLLSGFPLIATQVRALPLHLGSGLGQGAFQVRTQLIDRILNIALIQGQKICRLHGVGAEGSLRPGARPVKHVAVPPVLVRSLSHRLGVQPDLGIFRGQHQVPVLQVNHQGLSIQALGLGLQGLGGLFLGHAAQIEVQGIYIVENKAVVPGIAPQEEAQAQHHHSQHSGHRNGCNFQPLFSPRLRLLRPGGLPVRPASSRLGHTLKIRLQPRPLLGGAATRLCKLTLFDIHRSYLQRMWLRLFFSGPLLAPLGLQLFYHNFDGMQLHFPFNM